MQKRILLFLIVFSFAIPCDASNWKKTFLLGYGALTADQSQTVHLNDTPAPGLDNRYVASSRLNGSTLFGLAFEKEFQMSLKNSISAAGFEIDYLHNRSVNGTVLPMYNVSPDFDVLKYSYSIDTLVIQAIGKLMRQKIFYDFGTYLQAGLGAAVNRLSNYLEYPPGDSSAAPMLSPYSNKYTTSPAFSAGVGITYKINTYDSYLSFGYRFFYAGKGMLMKTPIQQSNNSITLSPIQYQFLVLSLTI